MFDFLFVDKESGEEFLVETDTLEEARETAKEYFKKPKFIERMSIDEGEWLGLDTY